jgi:hypothetical protein
VSVERAEADYHAEVHKSLESEKDRGRAQTLRKPFGFQNETWEALKAQLRPGDELWEFCSARPSWDALMGLARYELRRDGVVIATMITKRN